MTHSRPRIRELLDEGHLAPRRDLGQNFVADANTVRRIAHLAKVGPGDGVVEIGAGLGSLTLALAETGAEVTAVEIDRGLAAALRIIVAGLANVRVVEADAMTLDWDGVLGPEPVVLVANLPYNVATPLVADVLDGVPQVARLLVMVQREVAERFAAAPRTPAYGAVSVKVAYWATARIVGLVPASVFVPRPNVESALVEIVRHEPPATDPSALFGLVRTAFNQRRKMLRRSLAGVVRRGAVRCRRRRTDRSPGGARRRRLVRARRGECSVSERTSDAVTDVLAAPAKLTWSLRVVGVRDDGYHLIDAEMLTLDLADSLTVTPCRRDHADGVGTVRRRRADRRLEPRGPAPSASSAATATCTSTSGSPTAAGSAAVRPTPRRSCAGRVSATSPSPPRLGADVPFCVVGGRARVTGIGEVVEPLPHVARTVTLVVPPLRVEHAGGVPRAGTSSAGRRRTGRNDLEPAALAVEPRLARWRDRIGDAERACPRRSPGSGATWFVEGETRRRPRRIERRGRDGGGVPDGPRRTAGRLLAALVARAAKHLLVLLLPHALAPLLDQRTHKVRHATGGIRQVRRYRCTTTVRGRSIGRTAGFGPENRGSIPLPGASGSTSLASLAALARSVRPSSWSGCAAPTLWRRPASRPGPPHRGLPPPNPRRRRTAARAPTGPEPPTESSRDTIRDRTRVR